MKRGFRLKREAKIWEQNFLERTRFCTNIRFKNFVEQYYLDVQNRLKANTLNTKRFIIQTKILPYFGEMLLSEIRPLHIRQWQNGILSCRNKNNQPYSETYLRIINHQLSALFNYAVLYYDLPENPCLKAGHMGKKRSHEMQIWTLEEFHIFIQAETKIDYYTAFNLLYFTGIRLGELLALTWQDIDFHSQVLNINKSYQRIYKEDIITTPKTQKSIRKIILFDYLINILKEYKKNKSPASVHERIITLSKAQLNYKMKKLCTQTNIKKIRIHDLRHSHASLLIELNFSPILIAERLGHENIETTLNTYSHLYPNKQIQLSNKLQELVSNLDQ